MSYMALDVKKAKRRTFTFDPTPEVERLVDRAMRHRRGVKRSWFINQALLSYLSEYARKREKAA